MRCLKGSDKGRRILVSRTSNTRLLSALQMILTVTRVGIITGEKCPGVVIKRPLIQCMFSQACASHSAHHAGKLSSGNISQDALLEALLAGAAVEHDTSQQLEQGKADLNITGSSLNPSDATIPEAQHEQPDQGKEGYHITYHRCCPTSDSIDGTTREVVSAYSCGRSLGKDGIHSTYAVTFTAIESSGHDSNETQSHREESQRTRAGGG